MGLPWQLRELASAGPDHPHDARGDALVAAARSATQVSSPHTSESLPESLLRVHACILQGIIVIHSLPVILDLAPDCTQTCSRESAS